MKRLYEMHGQGASVRTIATTLGISRNTVRKYVRAPDIPKAKPATGRGSKLDAFKDYVQQRLADGLDNCVVLLREIRKAGYSGGITILKDYVRHFRRQTQASATVRFETDPGEQAQVDWGKVRYQTPEGKSKPLWVFVLVLSWSRAIYVEFVQRADVTTFMRCHVNAFSRLGGTPGRCLYDNAKVVVLGRDEAGEPAWNEDFMDFALRLGFEVKLCRPYRPRTKGRVESGVGYVKGNFWPSARFVDLEDLNREAQAWVDTVADVRIHGTTKERPADRLAEERPRLRPVPGPERLAPFLRDRRKVGRDGYVQWEKAAYGVSWRWVGKEVQVQAEGTVVEIWAGEQRLAVHPRATRPGQRSTLPGQWEGLPSGDGRPRKEARAVQVSSIEVEQRSLAEYQLLVGRGAASETYSISGRLGEIGSQT